MSIAATFRQWRKHRDAILAGEAPSRIRTSMYFRYVSNMVIATPPWVEDKDLRGFYKEVKRLDKRHGIKHSVDHIIPLCHPRVCGLNVPANLQVITLEENTRKGNTWCQWQGVLFDQPEQFYFLL